MHVLAHGVGGRQDLPIPFSLALIGGGIAVLASFLALGLLWPRSRFRGGTKGRPLPDRLQAVIDGPALRWSLRLLGLAFAAFVLAVALFVQDDRRNPTAGLVYVWLWVGLVPASLLFGPVWRQLNPLRTIHRGLTALGGGPPERALRPLPERLGYWPAAAGLFAFTWLELVAPERTAPGTILAWFGGYAAVMIGGAAVYGSRWFDRCDAFEVYSGLIGRLSPFGRRVDGRLVVRNPFEGLDSIRPAPGLVAVVCVMLGSTAFDGFSGAPWWADFAQSGPLPQTVIGTLALATFVLAVVASYVLATRLSGLLATPAALPARFAHSIVPIAVGYVIAHYFSLLFFEGPNTLFLATDVLGLGGGQLNYNLISAGTIAMVQVGGVVGGHVLGVVAAHDRAVRLFPRSHAIAGQVPLLLLMVGYTVGGLTLLLSG